MWRSQLKSNQHNLHHHKIESAEKIEFLFFLLFSRPISLLLHLPWWKRQSKKIWKSQQRKTDGNFLLFFFFLRFCCFILVEIFLINSRTKTRMTKEHDNWKQTANLIELIVDVWRRLCFWSSKLSIRIIVLMNDVSIHFVFVHVFLSRIVEVISRI